MMQIKLKLELLKLSCLPPLCTPLLFLFNKIFIDNLVYSKHNAEVFTFIDLI